MNSSIDDIKDDVKELLQNGLDEQAIRLLMSKIGINREDAVKLSNALRMEMRRDPKVALEEFKQGAISSIKSSIPLLLKGSGVCFGIVALLVIIGCSIGYYLSMQFERKAVEVEGSIADFHRNYETDEVWLIVEYEFDAEHFSIESQMTYDQGEFQLGQNIKLLVGSDRPALAVINSFKERFLAVYVIGGVALGILIFSIFLWIAGRQYGRRWGN